MSFKSINQWLIDHKVKGHIIPNVFDLPELWNLNAQRFRGFNYVSLPFYVVFVIIALPSSILDLLEAVLAEAFPVNPKQEQL